MPFDVPEATVTFVVTDHFLDHFGLETARDLLCEERAGLGVEFGVGGLAGVVQEEREIEHAGVFELLKERLVIL